MHLTKKLRDRNKKNFLRNYACVNLSLCMWTCVLILSRYMLLLFVCNCAWWWTEGSRSSCQKVISPEVLSPETWVKWPEIMLSHVTWILSDEVHRETKFFFVKINNSSVWNMSCSNHHETKQDKWMCNNHTSFFKRWWDETSGILCVIYIAL